jgi:hypothetical protein
MRATTAMHQRARADAAQAFAAVIGASPTSNELRFLLAEGLYDSTFGAGWHGDGISSNNIGAIHSYSGWKGGTFSYTDSHPDGTRYTQTFKKYDTAAKGWEDLVHEFYVRRPSILTGARTGSAEAVGAAMVRSKYAEGFGDTEAERIEGWRRALQDCVDEIDAQQGAPGPSITIRVQNPQGDQIGIATISEAVAPGLTVLASTYGAPIMIAYPNGWRVLNFAPGVLIPAKTGIPFAPIEQKSGLTFGWQSGAVLGILGIVVTIFVGTLQIQPGKRAYGNA